MKSFFFVVLSTVLLGFLSGCAGTANLKEQHSGYTYSGEKYGKVTVSQSEKVLEDVRKGMRLDEMALDKKIIAQLKSRGVYDESSQDSVVILINSIYIRNAFNAIMFGVMSGVDNIDGTVTLLKENTELAKFDVNAAYALGGLGGGQNEVRLTWLSDKFAEQTADMILGKSK